MNHHNPPYSLLSMAHQTNPPPAPPFLHPAQHHHRPFLPVSLQYRPSNHFQHHLNPPAPNHLLVSQPPSTQQQALVNVSQHPPYHQHQHQHQPHHFKQQHVNQLHPSNQLSQFNPPPFRAPNQFQPPLNHPHHPALLLPTAHPNRHAHHHPLVINNKAIHPPYPSHSQQLTLNHGNRANLHPNLTAHPLLSPIPSPSSHPPPSLHRTSPAPLPLLSRQTLRPFHNLPSPVPSSPAPSSAVGCSRTKAQSNKKIKLRLPLEHTPDRRLALDESRIRSRWLRVPLKLSFHLISSQSNPNPAANWEYFMTCPDSSLVSDDSQLLNSIDVYLPGREVWDDYRMEMLDDRLTALGYPSKITLQHNPSAHSQHIDTLDEHEQDLRSRLDLRKRLQAFLDDNPEADLQIPPIHGIFPLSTRAQPPNSPHSFVPSSSRSPLSTSQLKPLAPVDIVHPSHQSVSLLEDSLEPFPISDSTQIPIAPSLKPTAPEFNPGPHFHPSNIHSTTDQLDSSSPRLRSLIPTLPHPPHSLSLDVIQSSSSAPQPSQNQETHSNLAPTLATNPDLDDDLDLLTDSDREQPQLESNPGYDLLGVQEQGDREGDEQEDNIPLAKLQHTLKAVRNPPLRPFISRNTPDNFESHYEGDVDRHSDCTNPSDEEDCLGDEEDNSINMSNLSQTDSRHHQLSPLSTPQNHIGRSHAFGMSSLSNLMGSMSAGKGQPHNWINGSENEEGDLISNPSDEEEAELYQIHKQTIVKSAYSEITSTIAQQAACSNFKPSTPTSRLLLNSVPSPDQATNLAITVGRATGSVMSLGMLEHSSDSSLFPHQASTSSLNAFAPEFKPNVILSSSLTSDPRGSTDLVTRQSSDGNNLLFIRDTSSKPPIQIGSISRGSEANQELKPQVTSHDTAKTDEIHGTNPGGLPSVILFEQPVSSAPFQVPSSFPILSPHQPAGTASSPSHSRKITLQQFEQPGKDNMRTFKFPAVPQSRMIFYQAQMSRSSLPAEQAPALQSAGSTKGSSDLLNPVASEAPDRSLIPLISTPQAYPKLVIDIPGSPALAQIHSDISVPLRQRSSFEDDSGSDISPSVSRAMMSEKAESSSLYTLIPTQPRSTSLQAKHEEQEEVDGEDGQRSPSSVVSLRQLQEQRRRWTQLTADDDSHIANSYHSGSETYPRCEADLQTGHSSHSVPLLFDLGARRKIENEPPQVVVPPGSPFSPFDGMMESSGSMYSFREDPPILKLPPSTSHPALTPPASRMLSLKPSHHNLSQSFIRDDRRQPSQHQDNEQLDGLPEISIRNRNLNLSPSSPSARWLASSEEENIKGSMVPTGDISKTDVEDENLFSSKILEERDGEDSSSGDSSSDSSLSIESNLKSHNNVKNHASHGFMGDLEKLLTRKLNGLRQDLGELHSLKVDWDSLKRDAIIDEITSLMDNILRSWSEPWKERITASAIPDPKADIILNAINQLGETTGDRMVEAINNINLHPDAIERIRSELENLNSRLGVDFPRVDLDSMTTKWSEVVKPQFDRLIDLASDRSETAHLISKSLQPYFTEFQTELESMTNRIYTGISEQNEKQTSNDALGRAALLTQLDGRFVDFQTDSQQRLLQLIDKQITPAILTEIKKGADDGLETTKQLHARTSQIYDDLSTQVNQVEVKLIKRLEAEVERGISRRQETDNLIDQLRAKNSELELNVGKARSEHGKIRSERAVERERNEEDRSRLIHERDRLKEAVENLQAEKVIQSQGNLMVEVEKNRLAASVEEMRHVIEELNASSSSYKAQESQWQILKAEQLEKIVNLQLKNQISESQIQTIKTEMELKQKFYETREAEKEAELIRLREKDLDQSNQIKKLIEDQIPLIKNFDLEIRDLIKLKSESDGEIRTLRKRISDQDEQIGNLHQSSASKQQALAMANQKLSELERRGKQESEGLKTEIEKLKLESNKIRIESEIQNKLIQEEKEELENEVNRLRSEVEIGSVKESAICQHLSVELDQSNQRRIELEEELKSFKDLNELLKNQIEDLGSFHQNQNQKVTNPHDQSNHHNPTRSMPISHEKSLFRDHNTNWKLNETRQPEFNQRLHELSLSIEEDGHEVRDFVRSTIPLTESIHAAPSGSKLEETKAFTVKGINSNQAIIENKMHNNPQHQHSRPYFSDESRRASNSSVGTVRSFRGSTLQPPLAPHIQFSSPSEFVLPPPDIVHHPARLGSPTPSGISTSSRSVVMDLDGWWSSTD